MSEDDWDGVAHGDPTTLIEHDGFHGRMRDFERRGIPSALVKANEDCFVYAARLRTGELIVFADAEINDAGTIARLNQISQIEPNPHRLLLDRGIDVRIEDIIWVADAPFGS